MFVEWSYRGCLFGGSQGRGDRLLGQELGDEAHGRAEAVRQVLRERRHHQRDPLRDLQDPTRGREQNKWDDGLQNVKKHKYDSLLFRFVALIQSDSQSLKGYFTDLH